MRKNKSPKFYAVRVGRTPGIYTVWETCWDQVRGYPGAQYKAFPTQELAEAYVQDGASSSLVQSMDFSPENDSDAANPSVAIWVDGACIQHEDGSMKFGWAFVVVEEDDERARGSGNDIPQEARKHRNVAGEICAVLQALSWCKAHGIRAATIYYDYQGLASWVDGSWKTNTPWTRQYAQAVWDSGLTLKWKKVRAHSGEPYNELADQLAKKAAQGEGVNGGMGS